MRSLGELRDIADDELALMLTWRNHPSVRKNMYTRDEITLDQHLAWWSGIGLRTDQKYFMYVNNEKPIGIAAFSSIDTVNRNSAWAFYASPDAPRGTGSKMEYLMLEHAFGPMALHKLYCEVLAFNAPVIGLHKKFGFREEGIFRGQHLYDGQFVDVHRMGVLDSEWRERSAAMFEKLTQASNHDA